MKKVSSALRSRLDSTHVGITPARMQAAKPHLDRDLGVY